MMDDKFTKAVSLVLKHEGGYVNDPHDPGGETKWGICKLEFPHLDIKNLTREDAERIYYEHYWKPNRYDQIKYEPLAIKVFDIAVNIGPRRANKLLQRAVCLVGPQIEIDGIIGPQTLSAVNSLNGDLLLRVFLVLAGQYYISLGRKRYLYGWLRRLFDGADLKEW